MISIFKDKRLGIDENGRSYDLPLHEDEGTFFLSLLITLMVFLAVMALAASFALSGMAERWSSGLENRLTIEIPAEGAENKIREASEVDQIQEKVADVLRKDSRVKYFDVMRKEEIKKLVEPWLGQDALLDTMPLPGMISVELKSSTSKDIESLTKAIKNVDPGINLDTHESWLRDLLKLTGALRFATFIITGLIAVTTIAAVAGGVRSRMAIHAKDVELLHLMGASDEYITRQFQRHTLILALKGAAVGTLVAIVVIMLIRAFSGDAAAAMLPDFSLGLFHVIILLSAPLAACLIAALTARLTVLRALAEMP